MAEESARVAQRCEAAKSSGELQLDYCGLRKFPDAVFFLMKGVELSKVSLSHNQLQKIPPKFGLKFELLTSKFYLFISHGSTGFYVSIFLEVQLLCKSCEPVGDSVSSPNGS